MSGMRVSALVVSLLACGALAACGGSQVRSDPGPVQVPHTPAPGTHSVSFHGVSVDVPDTAKLVQRSTCGFPLPSSGDLVVPFFDGPPSECPGQPLQTTPAPARPASALTVFLAETGTPVDRDLPRPRTAREGDVTVTASGPPTEVGEVLGSLRSTPTDDLGCVERADPTVAPRNTASSDGRVAPATARSVVVCEYAPTALPSTGGDLVAPQPYWLVGSSRLTEGDADHLLAQIRGARVEHTTLTTAPVGPMLHLLVSDGDGHIRTLQAFTNDSPDLVTDGRTTVGLGDDGHGTIEYVELPTPFTTP
jgi:hypothetical protein